MKLSTNALIVFVFGVCISAALESALAGPKARPVRVASAQSGGAETPPNSQLARGTGACCYGAACSVELDTTCAFGGGYYLGDGTDCSASPCDAGACCILDITTVICDDAAGTMDESTCTVEFEGTYIGGALCDSTADPCPACQFYDSDHCQADADSFIFTSDRNSGLRRADDFEAVGTLINRVCWRFGYYPAPGQPECADNPPDGAFEIRFYENSSGVPGLELANSPGSVIPDRRKRKAGTRIWDYSAPISPSITVSTGSCYWIEITADGTANCVTGWAGSDDGNSFSMWDGDGEYTIEDIQPDDMAFCIDTEIIPGSEPGIDGGCGRVDVACCLPGGDCDDLGVYGECFDAYGVHFFGEACGSITCPDPGNDDCAEAAVICEDLDIDGDVGACDNADGIEGPACSVSVPDCYDLSSCNAWNYDAYRCTVDTDNRLTNTDGPDTIGTDCQPSGNNAFQADVWYHVVAPCKGDMVVNMCNAESSYDALMGIFGDHTETCICPSDNDANLACSDDFCGGPAVASAAEVAVERDACYTIRVGGWSYDGTALDAAQGESELDIGFFCDFTHLYVDADVIGGANDGTSWPNAFASLQDALSEASLLGSITDIWVAEGTYHPDEGVGIGSGDRNASFQLLDGVAIYGGFVGNETQFGQRNVTDNVTILSGDLDDNDADPTSDCCTAHGTPGCDDVACETAVCAADAFCCIEPWDATCADLATTTYCVALCAPGDNSENSYHVVNGSGTDTTAALDGFTISGGNADLLGFVGGGVYNDSGSPTLSNCIFANNKADVEGGGIWNNGGSPIITDCTFTSNSATVGGAAVNTGAGCAPTYSGCIFSSNTATSHSGAMHNAPGSTPEVIDCRFSRNSAPGTGAVWSDSSDAVFVDCTFVDNVSTGAGPGALDVTTGEVEVVNCTFLGNEAESYGGALGARIGATVNVTNCVFSGNTAVNESGGAIVASDLGTNLTVTNSTFSLNDAGNLGGGIRVDTDAGAAVKNSIFWRNSDIGGMDESAQIDSSGGSAAVDYSIVQDGWTGGGGTGNSSGDPRFVDADGIDDIAGTEDDNVRLSPGSPGLDAGFNDALPADTEDIDDDGNVGELTPIDLAGYPRFKDDPFTDPDPGDAGTSGLPVVDMGAYEYTPPLLVDIDAVDGNQDGSSWENAFLDPAEALAVARDSAGAVTEIWVAAGEYPPTGGDRTASVELVDGVGVYGGFAGTEIFREDRNVKDNQTILSGDRNGDDASVACGNDSPDCDSFGGRCVEDFCIIADNNGDNVYHVVTASGVGPTTVLDGFTVTAGNANGSFEDSTDRGGGMHSNAGSPTVTHCTFRGNSATFGGGMHNKNDSSPTLIGCTFSGNSGTDAGGGMINVGSHPTLTNCTFSWNSATNFGGGMYSVNSSTPTLIDCTFSRNLATGDAAGGGMSSRFSSHPTLTNCTFTGNLADRGGGMH
ncbi:MAG: right-handed parallel beta-helix repeat-containing protein, partial [Phycisphaerales bacterium]